MSLLRITGGAVGKIVGRYILPHSPFLLPGFGADCEDRALGLLQAYEEICDEIGALSPDLIVVLSPLGICFKDHFYVFGKKRLSTTIVGNDSRTKVKVDIENDRNFVSLLSSSARNFALSAGSFGLMDLIKANVAENMDYGLSVPLFGIQQRCRNFKAVAIDIGNPLPENSFAFGCALYDAVASSDCRVVVVASGELAKRHMDRESVPCSGESREYDKAVLDIVRECGLVPSLLASDSMQNRVRGDALNVIRILLGTLCGRQAAGSVRYYGVHFENGYLIASIDPLEGSEKGLEEGGRANAAAAIEEYAGIMHDRTTARQSSESYLPRLARRAARRYFRQYDEGREIRAIESLSVPVDAPAKWTMARAGVCVSFYLNGRLRARSAFFEARSSNVAAEVIDNSIKAITDEFGYPLFGLEDLDRMTIEVGVTKNLEEFCVEKKSVELDPKKHGVLVCRANGEGYCLPREMASVEDLVGYAVEQAACSNTKKCVYKKFEMDCYR